MFHFNNYAHADSEDTYTTEHILTEILGCIIISKISKLEKADLKISILIFFLIYSGHILKIYMYMDLSYSKGQRIKSLNIIVSIIQNIIEHLFLLQSIMLLKVPEMYADAGWQDLTSLLYLPYSR